MHARSQLVCLAVLITACSDPGTTVGSTADAEHFCRTLSQLSIDKQAECFKVALAVTSEQAEQVADRCAAMQHEVDAARASYDAVKGSACAHSLAALPGCAAYASMMNPTADCTAAVRGTVGPTGACWSASDCADGYCTSFMGCGGQCVAYSMEGQPCTTPCAPGLVCTWDYLGGSPYGICSTPSDVDGPCPCKQGLFCDYGPAVTGGGSGPPPTCQPQLTSGFCHNFDECAPGFVCAGEVSSCVPLVGLGAPCGAASYCGWGSYCDSATSACAAYPDLGQACVLSRNGTTAELRCIRGTCDSSGTKTCVARKPEGEACTSYDECASYFCDSVQQRCGGVYVPPVCTPP